MLEERQVIGGQAVGTVTGNGVMDSGADQGEAVDYRFGEDDFLVGLGGLPVEEAAPGAGKVEVRRALAVVHLLDAPAVDAGRVAGQVKQREGGAAVEVLASSLVQDAQLFQPVDDVALRGQHVEKRSVGKADAMRGKQGVVGDAASRQVFPGSAVFAEGLVVELDHAGEEFDLFGGEQFREFIEFVEFREFVEFYVYRPRFQRFNGFRKAHLVEQLNKADGVAARAAAEALPEVFFRIDGERRGFFGVEGTQANVAFAFFLQLDAA